MLRVSPRYWARSLRSDDSLGEMFCYSFLSRIDTDWLYLMNSEKDCPWIPIIWTTCILIYDLIQAL